MPYNEALPFEVSVAFGALRVVLDAVVSVVVGLLHLDREIQVTQGQFFQLVVQPGFHANGLRAT